MHEQDLKIDSFIEWLKTKIGSPDGAGLGGYACGCPIANWLLETTCNKSVSVSPDSIVLDDDFAGAVDISGKTRDGKAHWVREFVVTFDAFADEAEKIFYGFTNKSRVKPMLKMPASICSVIADSIKTNGSCVIGSNLTYQYMPEIKKLNVTQETDDD
jgi:hypothetical protein